MKELYNEKFKTQKKLKKTPEGNIPHTHIFENCYLIKSNIKINNNHHSNLILHRIFLKKSFIVLPKILLENHIFNKWCYKNWISTHRDMEVDL